MGNEILDQNIQSTTTFATDVNVLQRLPKDTSTLVTGIIAIPFSFGLIGIILSIITLVNASSATREYNANPDKYLESSFKKVKAGKICAIVSLSLLGAGVLALLGISIANS